ncbi:methyl-accepting chemotaxis protein [Chitinimonas arctica]|nr:methyl-accepting chemotaxis protein [Chitinimonas arctica]
MINWIATLMRRLSYPVRFGLIGAVATLALIYLGYGLYRTNQDNVDFSAKERLGVLYLDSAVHVLAALLEARNVAAEPDGPARMGAVSGKVDAALAKAATIEQTVGAELGTAKGFATLKTVWEAARASDKAPVTERIVRHNGAIEQSLGLLITACDNSNLTLDPDIDSYYLMDAVCVKLPSLAARLGEQTALQLQALGDKALDDVIRTRLVELRPLVFDAHAGLRGDLDKSFAYNKELAGKLKDKLDPMVPAMKAVADGVDKLLGNQLDAEPAAAARQGMTALSQAIALTMASRVELDGLLSARLQRIALQRNTYVAASAGAILAVLLLFVALYRSITRQLGGEPFYVEGIVKRIADGRLDTQIDVQAGDDSSLLATIVLMRDKLRAMVTDMLRLSDLSAKAARQLADNVGQVAHASTAQSDAVAAAAAAIEQLSTSIMHGANTADDARRQGDNSSNAASDGGKVIRQSIGNMGDIAKDVEMAARTIETLGQQSSAISTVVNVIRDVADQTNLLALNAAIEAARAGEAGRGFAVVADEVRKLAGRSANASSEIANFAGTIRTAADEAVVRMQATVRAVESGRTDADAASDAIGHIHTATDGMVQAIQAIAEDLGEQRSASQQLAQHIEAIAAMSESNANSASQGAAAARELHTLSSQLAETAQRFTV